MAEKRKSSSLARLTPNAMKIVGDDGKEIFVASDSAENKIFNMILNSQMRALIQEQIKKYKDSEATLTPKELKELADAVRSVSEGSSEVYKNGELPNQERTVQPTDESDDVVDLSKIGEPADPPK